MIRITRCYHCGRILWPWTRYGWYMHPYLGMLKWHSPWCPKSKGTR